MSPVAPPRWSADQLEVARRASIHAFREERMQEPLGPYREAFATYRAAVEHLLEATLDLSEWSAPGALMSEPIVLEALRYLAAPPISADDLRVLADASLAPSRLRRDPEMARRVVETVLIGLDRQRFPWVVEERAPEPEERDAAILASAVLLATQRLSTDRRSEGKTRQESAVARALTRAGFRKVPTRTIVTLPDAPNMGQF